MQNKQLKILHLFNTYLPQTQNWAYNLILNLPDCEIHIGAKNYLKENFYNNQFHFIDNHFDAFNQKNQQLSNKRLLDIFKKITLKCIPFIFGTTERFFINYAKDNQIQLVHIHFANVGWKFRKVAQQLNLPLIISFYGWDYEKLPYTQPEYLKRFSTLFQIADGFICEGNHGASIIENYGCPKEKIFVVPLGVKTSDIPIIKRIKKTDTLQLIQIASFTEKKGHQYAIRAVAKLIEDCPNIQLTLIGNDRDPQIKADLINLVTDLDLDKHIHFLPSIDYKYLYDTLDQFDVFIHPSCYASDRDCEGGAPVVILDAQATGMPIISTTHCDIPDEVIHNKTGLLSAEKNVTALAENIKTFYHMDNEFYQTFAQHARQHVIENFDIKKNGAKLKDVYNQILKIR